MTSGRNRGPQQAAPSGQREAARAAAPSAAAAAAKGQGDHTVAETLLVQAIRGVCRLKGYWEAYSAVYTLIPTFAQENEIERYDAGALLDDRLRLPLLHPARHRFSRAVWPNNCRRA